MAGGCELAMKLTREQVRCLASTVDLQIPESELDEVLRHLESLMTVMEEIETKIGDQLDQIEPVPPVFPRGDF